MTCHACGATLPGTARFCHKCGAAVAASSQGSAGWQAGLPWAVAGAAVGALVTVLMLGVGESRERGAGPDGVPEGTAPRSPLPAPDISQMSPEERARRRPEYAEHQNTIDAFHAEALRVTGGKSS